LLPGYAACRLLVLLTVRTQADFRFSVLQAVVVATCSEHSARADVKKNTRINNKKSFQVTTNKQQGQCIGSGHKEMQ